MNISENFKLIDIKWNRIFLQLQIAGELGNADFYLTLDSQASALYNAVPIVYDGYTDGAYFFNLDICQIDGRSFLDNGKWFIAVSADGKDEIVSIDSSVAYDFDNLSRLYRYKKGKAYSLSFSVEERDNMLFGALDSAFMKMDNDWKERGHGLKKAVLKMAIKAFNIFAARRKKGNNVLFLSQTKDAMNGNLKAVSDRLIELGYDKEYNITYHFNNDVGNGTAGKNLVKLALLISKQKIIFVEDYVPAFSVLTPAKDTKLVQLWHAGIGFKAVGYCRFGKPGSPHPVMSCHRKYDYAIAPTEAAIDVFREVFGIEREAFIISGLPRMDGFLDEQRINDFKEKFYVENPKLKGRKLILFAPTYRGNGQSSAYYDYDKLDQDAIAEVCGDEYVFIVKMHPFIKDKLEIKEEYADIIYDFSDYGNINDLYYVTDVLITDYSSNFFEFTALERPIIFYTYDRKVYELTRGVHASVKDSAPGIVCDDFSEVIDSIKRKNFEIEKTLDFKKKYWSSADRLSSDIIIDEVFNGRKNNE